jgi:hypothetical protein
VIRNSGDDNSTEGKPVMLGAMLGARASFFGRSTVAISADINPPSGLPPRQASFVSGSKSAQGGQALTRGQSAKDVGIVREPSAEGPIGRAASVDRDPGKSYGKSGHFGNIILPIYETDAVKEERLARIHAKVIS